MRSIVKRAGQLATGVVAASIALTLAATPAFAVPGGGGPQIGACANALTMLAAPFYVACQGAFDGNINGADAELATLAAFGGDWAQEWKFFGKSDDAENGPFAGAAVGSPATGTLTLDKPLQGWFVVGIKQANFHSFYLYNATSEISEIAIDSRGTAPNNNGFSHVNLYAVPGDLGGGGGGSVVPEPSTYALLGTGMLGLLGVAARRRKQQG